MTCYLRARHAHRRGAGHIYSLQHFIGRTQNLYRMSHQNMLTEFPSRMSYKIKMRVFVFFFTPRYYIVLFVSITLRDRYKQKKKKVLKHYNAL